MTKIYPLLTSVSSLQVGLSRYYYSLLSGPSFRLWKPRRVSDWRFQDVSTVIGHRWPETSVASGACPLGPPYLEGVAPFGKMMGR